MSADKSLPLVKIKVTYIRFLLLADKENEIPVIRKSLRGSKMPTPIYDAAAYQIFTSFNNKPESYEWQFSSTEGQVDDVLQLYPFDSFTFNANPVNNPGDWWHSIDNPATNEVLFHVHLYNSFQKGLENAFTVAEQRTQELRLTADFSAIITKPGKEHSLFIDQPKAFFKKRKELSKEVLIDYKTERIFSAVIKDVSHRDSLFLEWKINWDNLAIWQGSYSDHVDGRVEYRNPPTLPGNIYDWYRSQIQNLKKEYDQLSSEGGSVEEFSRKKLLPFVVKLSQERQSIDLIGRKNADSLTMLRINLSTVIDEYRKADELGSTSRHDYYREILLISGKIILKLDEISNTVIDK